MIANMEITSKLAWGDIDWARVESKVTKLQRRIYRASASQKIKVVQKLQRLLVKSWSARVLAVRTVTQENQGKHTAGVDGVKSVPPTKRLKMVNELKLDGKSQPIRRVWIPKPGKSERRGLGIPTIAERAKQALLKLALEPEWEAKFEPNSYGFRPGRSCHDAIEHIRTVLVRKTKYVLEADIEKCFDQINHSKLVDKATQVSGFKRQLRAWLKAGFIEDSTWSPTERGTPQGGVISPLLANIALDGMEKALEKEFPSDKIGYIKNSVKRLGSRILRPILVRYADDFVVLCENLEVLKRCQQVLEQWLTAWGLRLKAEKTRIIHSLEEFEGRKPGFDFLGVNIRQYRVGKKHQGGFSNGRTRIQLEHRTYTQPAKASMKRHYQELAATIDQYKGKPQKSLIAKLVPKIRGWCNYYKPWNSSRVFNQLSTLLWRKLWRWSVRRHPNKNAQWIMQKYWHTVKSRKWTFAALEKEEVYILRKHDQYPAGARHAKVQGRKSPYDGDEVYWCKRMGQRYQSVDPQKARLLKRQTGKCHLCKMIFKPGDRIEKHHLILKSKGGTRADQNMVLLHLHCHDKLHSNVASSKGGSSIPEEPDEVKVSSPVLKPSQEGDLLA